ncbi:tyrosinase family protein [Streptomyces rubrisoli]|uniref:Tyrosinase family protein n=2 Tax=Streptantibioticus rubrisoli TaxID=1387313 RepID=A0ABT1P7V4_9ACTN|nr:tyrosinase family protein [Streptantibioticus rubrisoli]
MTAQERRRFIQAVLEIKRRGSYDELVALHVAMNATDFRNKESGVRIGHISPGFLPWHRQFLLEFERELQSVDPTVSVPYWDWTTDQALDSPLWADDFMGGNGRKGDRMVVTGPFAHANGWRINTSVVPQGVPALNGHYSVDDRRFLTRDLGANIDRLPTARELEDTLALKVYDSEPFNHLAGGEAPFHSFRNHLEGYVTFPWEPRTAKLHSRGHRWSGGHMGYIASPNDPLFFLHHCFIDRCWAVWQQRHPHVPHYLPVEETDEVPGLHTPMEPWRTMTPADVVDHTAFYTYDS